MILYINACVRQESRTRRLAENVLVEGTWYQRGLKRSSFLHRKSQRGQKELFFDIKDELDDLEFQRDSRLIDKAELATQEVQIRSLLKVIDQKAAVNPPEGFAVRMLTEDVEDNLKPDVTDENVPEAADDPEERRESGNETAGGCGEIPCEHDGACYELADFYDRTDRIPTDTAFYSEDLVKRYIQSITVKTKFLVVKFKAGVEVKAKA